MSEVPTDWKKVKICEVIKEMTSGQSPNRMEHQARNGEKGILKTTAIQWGRFLPSENLEALPGFEAKESTIVRKNDILITKAGPSHRVGVVAFSKEDTKNLYVSGKMAIIRTHKEVDPLFLAYQISHSAFQRQLLVDITGMAQSQTNFTHDNFLSKEIFIPQLREQQKIAEVISSIDKTIETSKILINKLRILKNSLRINILRKGLSSKKWKTYSLKDISEIIDSLHITPSFCEKGFPMVRVSDIKTGNLSLTSTKKVSNQVFDKFVKKYHPKKGDIVMSRVGSYGVCSYVSTGEKFCIGQNTVVINTMEMNSRYLYECLNSNFVQNQIELEVAGSGYKSLSLAHIKKLQIPYAPIDEQNKFALGLTSIDNLIINKEKNLKKINALKIAITQDLFSGSKRVNL